MRRVVFDVEGDNLLPKVTRIHSLVLRDLDSGALVSCTDDSSKYRPIDEGLEMLAKCEKAYGHNVISYDAPALAKVRGFKIDERKVRDTLITARLWRQNIADSDWAMVRRKTLPGDLVGKQSLKAWGYRLGLRKIEYTEWCAQNGITEPFAEWREEMQKYCEGDTDTTKLLVKLLASKKLSPESIETEHELAWFLAEMEQNGFPLNVAECERLYAVLSARRELLAMELREVFKPWVVEVGPFTPKRNNKTLGYVEGCPATKIKYVEFKPSSRDHIVGRLKALYGWEPREFNEPTDANPEGNAKLDDEIIKALPYPEAPKLAEYLLVAKRIGQLAEGQKAWLKFVDTERISGAAITGLPHVHGEINQLGAVTHRATHKNPNMSQVTKVKASKDGTLLWGAEGDWSTDFRNVWHVPPGWKQLGADASGLELRGLSHFMARYDGGAYAKIVVEGRNEDGTDPHSVNRNALGLEGKPGREIAKTFIYAYLYGAGDEKLGSIVEPGSPPERQRELGAELRARFERNLPALGRLIEAVGERAKDVGYFTVLDGRRISIRHEHAALNSLLQSSGAVICKRWLVECRRRLTKQFGPQGWRGQWAGMMWSHDEVQMAVRPDIAEEAAVIVVQAIRDMTTHFSFRCPLDGEAKIGTTWAECH